MCYYSQEKSSIGTSAAQILEKYWFKGNIRGNSISEFNCYCISVLWFEIILK